MPDTCACDYCGETREDLMPTIWKDRTRWFCGLECLGMFKAVVLGTEFHDEALDGPPGTAKKIFEKLKTKECK